MHELLFCYCWYVVILLRAPEIHLNCHTCHMQNRLFCFWSDSSSCATKLHICHVDRLPGASLLWTEFIRGKDPYGHIKKNSKVGSFNLETQNPQQTVSMHKATTFTLTFDLITIKPIESIWASKENNRVLVMARTRGRSSVRWKWNGNGSSTRKTEFVSLDGRTHKQLCVSLPIKQTPKVQVFQPNLCTFAYRCVLFGAQCGHHTNSRLRGTENAFTKNLWHKCSATALGKQKTY